MSLGLQAETVVSLFFLFELLVLVFGLIVDSNSPLNIYRQKLERVNIPNNGGRKVRLNEIHTILTSLRTCSL